MNKYAGRLGDRALAGEQRGPAVRASVNVLIERRLALREDDIGVHEGKTSEWIGSRGARHVLINRRAALRLGDRTLHGGVVGALVEGASYVLIGDAGEGRKPERAWLVLGATDAEGRAIPYQPLEISVGEHRSHVISSRTGTHELRFDANDRSEVTLDHATASLSHLRDLQEDER